MRDNHATLQAIERLQAALWAGLQPWADEAPALAATCGIGAIDALLPHVEADGSRAIIEARWRFLGNVRDAMQEPPAASGRGRKAKAEAVAQHLRDAAAGLQELGSDGLAKALVQLAALTEARAHVSRIDVLQLSSSEIVPGMRLRATHRPQQLSAYYPNKRGAASHRAELIRFVCHGLQESAPPALVATLLCNVLGIDPCTHADVQQARGSQARSIRESRAGSAEAKSNAALRDWRV